MTVYKNTNLEAKAGLDLAIALINGDEEAADGLATGAVEDTEAGTDVPSVLATPEAIYSDGVAKVIADGFQPKDDVCTGDVRAALHRERRAVATVSGARPATIGRGHRSRPDRPARQPTSAPGEEST